MGKFVISEEEKRRILNMHQSKYTKNLLKETVGAGSTLGNGMTIKSFDTRSLKDYRIVFVQTSDDGSGQNYSCAKHEKGQYTLSPKGTLTQEESQSIYDQFCKSK